MTSRPIQETKPLFTLMVTFIGRGRSGYCIARSARPKVWQFSHSYCKFAIQVVELAIKNLISYLQTLLKKKGVSFYMLLYIACRNMSNEIEFILFTSNLTIVTDQRRFNLIAGHIAEIVNTLVKSFRLFIGQHRNFCLWLAEQSVNVSQHLLMRMVFLL